MDRMRAEVHKVKIRNKSKKLFLGGFGKRNENIRKRRT